MVAPIRRAWRAFAPAGLQIRRSIPSWFSERAKKLTTHFAMTFKGTVLRAISPEPPFQ